MTINAKKNLTLATSLLFFLFVTACSKTDNYNMSMKPSEFSEETLKILDLFDDEIQFFDLKLDETAKSYTISVWVYKDNQWQEGAMTTGAVDFSEKQIALEITDDSYKLYLITDDGHTSIAYPAIETDFENSMGVGGSRIDRELPIELNKEFPIWVKIGTEDGSMRVMNITEDFRNNDCNTGIAVTLTVSDKVVD